MERFWEILAHWSDPEFLAHYRDYLIVILFLYSFLEVIFPPLPGDTLLILSGSITGYTGISPFGLIISASSGTFVASVLLYNFGAGMERALLNSDRFSKVLDSKTFHRMEELFKSYGFWTIIFSRFLPVVRSGIILAAGIVNLKKAQTLITVGISIILSTSLFVMGGRFLGKNWRRIPELWHDRIKTIVAVLLCLLIIYCLLNYFYRLCRAFKKRIREQNE